MASLGSRLVRWLRSAEVAEPSSDGVVTLDVRDEHVANAVVRECEARGISVQLVADRVVNYPMPTAQTYQLLVLVTDLDQVREIAAEQEPDA
jgi:hypothetical protein